MEIRSTRSPRLEQQEKSLFLFVVVVGYVLTFTVAVNGGEQFTVTRLVTGIGCGAVYLVMGFFEAELLQRFSSKVRNAVFFSLQTSLVFGIGWVLGPGGNWLIGLPLAGIAVEKLSSPARWLVYVGLLAAIILPIFRYSTWQAALMNAFIISTAIFFVALITQHQLNERHARLKAEELATQLRSANRQLSEKAVEELGRTSHPFVAIRSEVLPEPLSDRELEVLRLVTEGLSNREIAQKLFISPGTAKTHIHHLCGKLGVRNRTEAAIKARELGLA